MLLVVALCLAAYLSNCRTLPYKRGADTIPSRLIPFAILGFGEITLDAFRPNLEAAGTGQWFLKTRRGSLVSFYPIGTGLAALPFYVPIHMVLSVGGPPEAPMLFAASEIAEKLTASAMTALAVGIFFLTARRRAGPKLTFGAALALGLGTSMWATASQMLWQHTAVTAALSFALWFLTWPGFPRWAAAAAGFALSLAVASRPTAALFLLAGLVATVAVARGRWLGHAAVFCIAAVPLIAFTAGVNWYYFGRLGGGYAKLTQTSFHFGLEGMFGLLVSPNRGLLIFTPIALLGILGLARQVVARERGDPVLLAFGAACLAHFFVMGSFYNWPGGWSFGPRYLVDILPILGLAAVDVWTGLPRAAHGVAVIALVWSLFVQWNGAFCYPASRWDRRILTRDPKAAAWNWRELALTQDFRAWRASAYWATPY